MSSSMRAIRPRHTSSSSVSMAATDRTAVTSPLANCSRPWRRLVSSPAFSSTATCFCTAAKLMSYLCASAETECSPASTRRMMSRRVRSASAWNRASARSSSTSVTHPTYNQMVVCCQVPLARTELESDLVQVGLAGEQRGPGEVGVVDTVGEGLGFQGQPGEGGVGADRRLAADAVEVPTDIELHPVLVGGHGEVTTAPRVGEI